MNRKILDPIYLDSENVILTCYFNTKKDPQAGASSQHKDFVDSNSYDYMYSWYMSMNHIGLSGIIFHDNLSEEFIEKYETDKIKFIKVELGSYSTNDERFIIYSMYLEKAKYKKVFMTDISDVFIKKDPFELIGDDYLHIGKDMEQTPKLGMNGWCVQKANQLIQEGKGQLKVNQDFAEMTLMNAGVIGGRLNIVLELIRNMSKVFEILKSNNNNNMMTLHYVIYKMNLKSKTGYPLTSKFKQFEITSDACIIHK
tara:strand:+ start:1288 stop:2052 length:765 start_codon:yes stop_codon:yes gene_type:complete